MADKEITNILDLIEKQNKRIDDLYDTLIQLAKAGAIQKVIIMDMAKQVGLTKDVKVKMKEIEKMVDE